MNPRGHLRHRRSTQTHTVRQASLERTLTCHPPYLVARQYCEIIERIPDLLRSMIGRLLLSLHFLDVNRHLPRSIHEQAWRATWHGPAAEFDDMQSVAHSGAWATADQSSNWILHSQKV